MFEYYKVYLTHLKGTHKHNVFLKYVFLIQKYILA